MNKLVCGMVVNEDLYDKYNYDKETGGRRWYTLCGQERSLDSVEFYANSIFCAKESPELVEVEQNKSNPTMLRLISDHCDANEISNQSARIYGTLARKNGLEEREAFRVIADMVRKSVSEDETTSSVWGAERSHFERLSSQQIDSMNAYAVQPAVIQGTAGI